jgi:hypothetical protein
MITKIIFWILFIDSIAAIIVALFGKHWFIHHFRIISRWFPVTIGWAIGYLLLVVWIGILTFGWL